MIDLTHEQLMHILAFDHHTGVFTWKVSRPPRGGIGDAAGYVFPNGYRYISIDGRRYYGHRLAWFYVNGSWPDKMIDHKDGDRTNNAISNLRLADNSENGINAKRSKRNSSGYKGVVWNKKDKRWIAQIAISGRTKYIGSFTDPKLAHDAYMGRASELYGEFARSA